MWLGGHPDHGRVVGDVGDDDRVGADARARADTHGPEDLGAGADSRPGSDRRSLHARPQPDGDEGQQRHLGADLHDPVDDDLPVGHVHAGLHDHGIADGHLADHHARRWNTRGTTGMRRAWQAALAR